MAQQIVGTRRGPGYGHLGVTSLVIGGKETTQVDLGAGGGCGINGLGRLTWG